MTTQHETLTQKDLKLFVIISEAAPPGDTYLIYIYIYTATIFCSFFLTVFSGILIISNLPDQKTSVALFLASVHQVHLEHSFLIAHFFSVKVGTRHAMPALKTAPRCPIREGKKVRQNETRHLGTLAD